MTTIKSPGVYIQEKNAFPNSVAPVATAVPAFIGYTPQAEVNGKSTKNRAVKISSFAEFKKIYCHPETKPPSNEVKQYSPDYYLKKQKSKPTKGDFIKIENDYYTILPDPDTIYYLYNSIRLFYENGGCDAYIVSVGEYGSSSGVPIIPDSQIVNSNIKLNELLNGLSTLKNEAEPTLYICPDATLLSVNENATLMQAMLLQNQEMKTAMSIFDVIGGNQPDPILYTNDIQTFRNSTGTNGLDYGAAYYPFVGTTIMQQADIDYDNLFGGDTEQLKPLLITKNNPNPQAIKILKQKLGSRNKEHKMLLKASATYQNIIKKVLDIANTLPPSGGIAGVMTTIDNKQCVWKAPANTSIVGVASLPINLNDSQQASLNVDIVTGKSINAIRSFNSKGILIWGARTLDGNSQDWRYVPVRRFMIYIEQSCKLAISALVFEPNEANTWTTVKSMLSNFLNNLWRQGGLQGAKASDAFYINCGLGSTMSATDILNGNMIIEIGMAVVRPAEFIVLRFSQQMAKS